MNKSKTKFNAKKYYFSCNTTPFFAFYFCLFCNAEALSILFRMNKIRTFTQNR